MKQIITVLSLVALMVSCVPVVKAPPGDPRSRADGALEPNESEETAIAIDIGKSPAVIVDEQDEDWLVFHPAKDVELFVTIECSGIGEPQIELGGRKMTITKWNQTFSNNAVLSFKRGSFFYYRLSTRIGTSTCQVISREV